MNKPDATPRCDKVEELINSRDYTPWRNLSYQLERELAEADRALAEAKKIQGAQFLRAESAEIALKTARAEAIEECAKVCDKQPARTIHVSASSVEIAFALGTQACSQAIRALSSKEGT